MSDFDLRLTPEGVQTLYYAVNEAIRMWPGSPARPVEEQEILYSLKMAIFAMKMELVIEKPSEGEA
jgi:hypothetical protein